MSGVVLPETLQTFRKAFATRDVEEFMTLVFPSEWAGIASRILESGVQMSENMCAWAPRWSPVPPTVRPRAASSEFKHLLFSCIYRAHDCIHQLWGLPRPAHDLNLADYRNFKKAQMCGEVAVLTLTEFALCKSLAERFPESEWLLHRRNALPLVASGGPVAGRSLSQIAARLDGLLHKKIRPTWVMTNSAATAFCSDYVPMLEQDRLEIEHNWELMRQTGWRPPAEMPDARYDPRLDGQELTLWMIQDFEHLRDSGIGTDQALVRFNRERRARIQLPLGWGVTR